MKKYLLIATAVAMTACTNKEKKAKYAQMEAASWIQGTWENVTAEGTMSEHWQKISDSLYNGQSYFIKGNDTLHNETISLFQTEGHVIYQPTVEGQNNDQPVSFNLIKSSDSLMVFENLKHDFPQRIVYRMITADSMVAEISGLQQGKPGSERYPMKRK